MYPPCPEAASPAGIRPLLFCSHAKAGSTWIDKILRTLFGKAQVLRGFEVRKLTFAEPKIYSAAFMTREEVLAEPGLASLPRFIVIRDLRDTLVSYYYSIRYSHPLDAGGRIETLRLSLGKMSKEEGLASLLDTFVTRTAEIQRSWIGKGELLFRYEDLLADDLAMLTRLFIHQMQLPVTPAKVERAVVANRFETVFKRKLGETDPNSHGRQGKPGDWPNHLSPELAREIEARFSDVIDGQSS